MILVCEKCQTRYLVKPNSLSVKGRTVKCAKCGHSWFQMPEGVSPPDVQQEPPERVAPIPKGSALPVVQMKAGAPGWMKIAAAAAFLFVIGSVPFFFYQDVLQKFPISEKVYGKLGIFTTKGVGLEAVALQEIVDDKGAEARLLRGKLVNTTQQARTLPHLRIKVLDKENGVLQTFTLQSSGEVLKPGEVFDFSNKIPELPKEALAVTLDIGNGLELFLR